MEIKVDHRAPEQIETEALVTYVFESEHRITDVLEKLDEFTGGRLRALEQSGELTGKALESVLLHAPPGIKARRLLLIGAGKAEKFTANDVRKITATAARGLKSRSVREFTFLARSDLRTPTVAQAAVEGAIIGPFEADQYKTEKKNSTVLEQLALAGFAAQENAATEAATGRGRIIAESQNFTRTLVSEPANRMTPRILAEKAVEMAREVGLEVEIFEEKQIEELKMGAFLSVARGSEEPPRLILLRYTPADWRDGQPVIGLVGKGITFDSGGISIKPSEGMEKMKYDMAGGATVLGVMRAAALLKLPHKILAIVPATENLPSGRAQKPGDVQVSLSGKTIEVINTDAEGRLVLADALSYARRLGCTHLIDAATLTLAIVVALANVNVGVFANDDRLAERLLASARATGEKMWRMPIDDDYREMIESSIADIQNTGSGRGGGACTAAMFLKEFVEETPWVHLDIAGTAWLDEAKAFLAKGPTGVAVRTLVHLLGHFEG